MPGSSDEGVDELLDVAIDRARQLDDEGYTSEDVAELLADLLEVADEFEDVLSTIDLARLAKVVRWENLPDAVDPEALDEAIETRDVAKVLDVRELIDLSDLPEIWASADAREAWRQKRELEDEIDDVTESLEEVTDGGGEESPEGEGAGPTGAEAGAVGPTGGGGEEPPDDREGDSPFSVDPETVENRVQMEVSDAIGEFREGLLAAHERFREIQQENRERFDRRRRNWEGTHRSRNPTAVSTLPDWPVGGDDATLHSTVPEETKYSSAPNRRRIYGPRWETARGDDDE